MDLCGGLYSCVSRVLYATCKDLPGLPPRLMGNLYGTLVVAMGPFVSILRETALGSLVDACDIVVDVLQHSLL